MAGKPKFYLNTDSVDIDAKSTGIHTMQSFDNRGLCIQIRHNGDKKLFELADQIAREIVSALNHPVSDTCPACGCTEMLCGHNGPGCTNDSNEEEE